MDAMHDEMALMCCNNMWDLVVLPKGGIDYKDTFSSVSTKDNFRMDVKS